jgi:hypothetical protein
MITIVLLVALALLSWIIFKPGWMPAPPENDISKKVVYQADVVKQKTTGWFKQIKPFWQKKNSLGAQLKSWCAQPDMAKTAGLSSEQVETLAGFQAWVESLNLAQADQIAQELSEFSQKQGIKLSWLLEDNSKADMQAALAGLALYFGLAVRERANARPAAALRAWEETPQAKENPTFGRRLFVELVDSKLIDIPASILLSTEKERRQHMTDSIRAVLEKDRSAVVACAEKVILDLDAKPVGKADKAQNAPMPAPIPAAEEV